ncbi:MAG: DUF2808 domain-containing protein [Leptolyngbyaceae cyanobacterium HOT.MB2.61]|nr:DUF2808 domain-containing protein [Leptolyngbyaceae cyanobacterium HOT.MB2.61]
MFKKTIHFPSHLTRHPFVSKVALTLGLLLPGSLLALSATAGQLQDGRFYFDHAPRLVRTVSTLPATHQPSTYQFTVKVPEDAGANLHALRITQDPNANQVNFDVNRSSAFLGDSLAGGPAVSLANVGGTMPTDSNEVMVVFAPPISPGQTVTVELQTDANPDSSGIYLFGVTAFPQGQNSPGIPLGHGRVNVYDHSQ